MSKETPVCLGISCYKDLGEEGLKKFFREKDMAGKISYEAVNGILRDKGAEAVNFFLEKILG